MRCINSEHTDPWFNLASEELLLRSRTEDYFLLYRNRPSIVVGKHQNTLAEINLPYVLENGIVVARRISGGGTVFHDLGNINFAFITSGKEGELVDYRKHTLPMIEAMGKMGLKVTMGKRNELLLGKQKISGTASHVFKHRALHHGTLLFSSELENLSAALRVKPGRFEDRAVKSIRSEVTNISDHLVEKMDVVDFQKRLHDHILDTMDGAIKYQYSPKDLDGINQLKQSKFSSWEWNFGTSPKYQFNKIFRFGSGEIVLHMNVEKGIIKEVDIEGEFLGTKDVHVLESILAGAIHDPATLRMRLSQVNVSDYINGLENEALLSGMF
ncbi:MAG: lipoate--protein ligase [Bacteroidota bacterium]